MRRKPASVVLVGRPNVGKSTLFNRMTGSRRAIVAPLAGTTRDSLERPVAWRGATLQALRHRRHVRRERGPAARARRRAGAARASRARTCSCFVVDGREGLVAGDRDDRRRAARRPGSRVILAVNKIDDKRARDGALEFYQLGFDPVFEISAEHGTGVGDLLDAIVEQLGAALGLDGGRRIAGTTPIREPSRPGPQPQPRPRPASPSSAGPTSASRRCVNRLLREERVMVSEMPGTTRDAIDAPLHLAPAAIPHRRHGRACGGPAACRGGGAVEMVSVRWREEGDRRRRRRRAGDRRERRRRPIRTRPSAGEADRAGRGIVIVANKWDLVKDRGPGLRRRSSTRPRGTGCGSSTTRRSSTSRR